MVSVCDTACRIAVGRDAECHASCHCRAVCSGPSLQVPLCDPLSMLMLPQIKLFTQQRYSSQDHYSISEDEKCHNQTRKVLNKTNQKADSASWTICPKCRSKDATTWEQQKTRFGIAETALERRNFIHRNLAGGLPRGESLLLHHAFMTSRCHAHCCLHLMPIAIAVSN